MCIVFEFGIIYGGLFILNFNMKFLLLVGGNICLLVWNYFELLGNVFYCCNLNDNMNFSDVDENVSISTLR